MQNNTTGSNITDDADRKGSYGGFQYRQDYDEYKKELEKKQQDKRRRIAVTAVIVAAFVILLGFVAVFVADTIMRTKGYTFYDFIHGTKPASLIPHKTDIDENAAAGLFRDCTVRINTEGAEACIGVVLTEDGYILTSCAAAADSRNPSVVLRDGGTLESKLVGEDEEKGICLLKVEKNNMISAEIGDSRALSTGQRVYCAGSGAAASVCSVVSADDSLKIAISGGDTSAGSPVLNTYGQVVGVVTGSENGNVTAIHMDAILTPIKKLITTQSESNIKVAESPVYVEGLDAYVETVTEKQAKIYSIPVGCYVVSAGNASPFRKDDIIVAANGADIKDADSLIAAVADGMSAFTVYRNGSYTDIKTK